MRVQVGILEFFIVWAPPPAWMWMGMDMDMDQVWLVFFINFFSGFEGVEIAFLLCFFWLGWAGEWY